MFAPSSFLYDKFLNVSKSDYRALFCFVVILWDEDGVATLRYEAVSLAC
jgi:hypothetical protein